MVYAPDSAGRVSAVTDVAKQLNYLGNFQYAASGDATQMTLGYSDASTGALTEAADINAMLQVKAIAACPGVSCGARPLTASAQNPLTLVFSYDLGSDPVKNNGTIQSQQINFLGTSVQQLYSYDALNRLVSAGETAPSWTQSYHYDGAGNRWVTGTLPPNSSVSPFTPTASSNFDPKTNQIRPPVTPYSTDPAGNQNTLGGYAFTFDAEGRLIGSTYNGTTTTYFYDGLGQRVAKLQCAGTTACQPGDPNTGGTAFVYDADGRLAAEYPYGSPPSNAFAACTPCYVVVDQIGSTRLVTDGSGTPLRRYDYLPFGEEIAPDGMTRTAAAGYPAAASGGNTDGFNPKFTGQYRDNETGFDFMNARYYSPGEGRFISPHPENAGAGVMDSQSWNGYSYVGNNPLTFVDPSGLQEVTVNGQPSGSGSAGSLSVGGSPYAYQAGNPLAFGYYLASVGPGARDFVGQAIGAGLTLGCAFSLCEWHQEPSTAPLARLFGPKAVPNFELLSSPGFMIAAVGRPGSLAANSTLAGKIKAALASGVPGKILEGRLARALIAFGEELVSFQREIFENGARIGEIDVETENLIIDATVETDGKTKQISRYVKDPRLNPKGKQVILFAPDFKSGAAQSVQALGVKVFRNLTELQRYLQGH